MTPGRLAVLIVAELIEQGFMENQVLNAPCAAARKVIEGRIQYGDVACIPDEGERQDVRRPAGSGQT